MKIHIFKKKDKLSIHDIEDFVFNHELKEKSDEELSVLVSRIGCIADTCGVGCDSMSSFRIRVTEKKLPAAVKKTILNSEEVKEWKEVLDKKEFKKYTEDLFHMAQLRMPWGMHDTRVIMLRDFIYTIDAHKSALSIVSEVFADSQLWFGFEMQPSIVDGIEDRESGFILSADTGSYKFSDGKREISIKGQLDSDEKIAFLSQASFISQNPEDGVINFTLNSYNVSISKKALFNIVDHELPPEDNVENAMLRFERLVTRPLLENNLVLGRDRNGHKIEI
jgi:hypothetical protein